MHKENNIPESGQQGFQSTHGMYGTPEYTAWINMKRRCYNKSYEAYQHYGGRGIIVCDRWLTSFENFIEDMKEKPSKRHSLDRINADGDYSPDNCRWATVLEQANNRRNNIIIPYMGRDYTAKEFAKEFGMTPYMVRDRYRKGFTPHEIATIPRKCKRKSK